MTMCKISDQAAETSLSGKPFRDGHTAVQRRYNGSAILSLYGAVRAQIDTDGFFDTTIGCEEANTLTVRVRLNAIWFKAVGKKPYHISKGFLSFDCRPIPVGVTAHFNPITKHIHLESNDPARAV